MIERGCSLPFIYVTFSQLLYADVRSGTVSLEISRLARTSLRQMAAAL
jgi:hypothetical protein